MSLTRRCLVEFLGTCWLVFGGCGTAVFAGPVVGTLGVALAFGFTVLTMVYAVGQVSGGHLNPAVSVGLAVAGRFERREVAPYIVSQVLGAVLASTILYFIARGKPGFEAATSTFAANGYGLYSPQGYSLFSGFLFETCATFFFMVVILGATSRRVAASVSGLAIGLCLALIHLIGIPITNVSVNPARATGPAIFAGSQALAQLWMFWVAPVLGAVLAGGAYAKWWHQAEIKADTHVPPEELPQSMVA